MRLRKWLEEYWGIDYRNPNNRNFAKGNFFQSRDFYFQDSSILLVMVSTGMVQPRTEAVRMLKAGSIRIGLGDEWTSFGRCRKLTADRKLEPNDLVRLRSKAFRIVPKEPTFLEELKYTFAEELGRIQNVFRWRASDRLRIDLELSQ